MPIMSTNQDISREEQIALMSSASERNRARVRDLLARPEIAAVLRKNHEATQDMKSPQVFKKV